MARPQNRNTIAKSARGMMRRGAEEGARRCGKVREMVWGGARRCGRCGRWCAEVCGGAGAHSTPQQYTQQTAHRQAQMTQHNSCHTDVSVEHKKHNTAQHSSAHHTAGKSHHNTNTKSTTQATRHNTCTQTSNRFQIESRRDTHKSFSATATLRPSAQ